MQETHDHMDMSHVSSGRLTRCGARRMKWVRDLVYKGLPKTVRGAVWMKMVRNDLKLDGAKYRELVVTCKSIGSSIPGVDEIPLDLPRTSFNGKSVDASQLLPVLQAVSMLHPDVGYVQGMSYGAPHSLSLHLIFHSPLSIHPCVEAKRAGLMEHALQSSCSFLLQTLIFCELSPAVQWAPSSSSSSPRPRHSYAWQTCWRLVSSQTFFG